MDAPFALWVSLYWLFVFSCNSKEAYSPFIMSASVSVLHHRWAHAHGSTFVEQRIKTPGL